MGCSDQDICLSRYLVLSHEPSARCTGQGNAVAYLQQAKRHGVRVEVLPMLTNGLVDVAALAQALESGSTGRTLVALTHVQTGESVIQPAAEVGALARRYGVVFLLDACQTVGQLPVNMNEVRVQQTLCIGVVEVGSLCLL